MEKFEMLDMLTDDIEKIKGCAALLTSYGIDHEEQGSFEQAALITLAHTLESVADNLEELNSELTEEEE